MNQDDVLSCVQVGPDDATHAVVWLHGLGADGHDFEPLVPALGMPAGARVRFVFPHADPRPVTINGGYIMRAWYDIRELSLGARNEDEEGILASQAQVHALVDRERERGVDPSRIVLAGFSQGGAIAIHAGLRYPERLAGIIALSCYLLRPRTLPAETSERARSIPILLAHGQYDPIVPIHGGQAAREALEAGGFDVRWRKYPMEHALHPDEVDDVGAFLAEVLQLR